MGTVTFKWEINKNEYSLSFVIPSNKFARQYARNAMRKHHRMLRKATMNGINSVNYSISHA